MRIPPIADIGPRFRFAVGGVLVLLLVALFYPYKTTIVPGWSLRVIDEVGIPVGAINVTQHWQHYLLETVGHEDLRQTAADGSVSFPDRTIRAGLLRRFLATVGKVAQGGIRAKREPYASVVVWGSRTHSTAVAVFNHDEEVPLSEIVVHSFR